MSDRLLKIATVSAAHGIAGEVRLKTFLEDQDLFETLGPYFDVSGNDLGDIVVRGQTKGQLIARIAGANNRDTADALKGLNLFVPRDALPNIEAEDEYYYEDLIGLKVYEDGQEIGRVKTLRDHGAGDMIEIEFKGGKTDLYAFRAEIFPSINLVAGVVSFIRPEAIVAQDEDGNVH